MMQANSPEASQVREHTEQYTYPELKGMLAVRLTYEHEEHYLEYLDFVRQMGGFNPETRTLTPLRFSNGFEFGHYLSSLTGALESGIVSIKTWPLQLFACRASLEAFLNALKTWDDRLTDRECRMVRHLGSIDWRFATNAEAADALEDAAVWLLEKSSKLH